MSLDSAFFSDTSREVSGDLGDENTKTGLKWYSRPPQSWSADYVLRNLGNVRRFVKMECYE